MKVYLASITIILTLLISCSTKNKSSAKNMANMEMSKKDTMSNMQNMTNMPGMNSINVENKDTMKDMQGMVNMPGMSNMSGMDKENKNGDQLVLDAQQIKLADIQVDTIKSGFAGDKIVLTATLNIDQKKITSVSSRVMGRVEKLYFKNIGDYVKKGDKLYDLYSEDLNNAEQEYRLAVAEKKSLNTSVVDVDALVQGAKNKLLLWGLGEQQIKALETSAPTRLTTFYSTGSGYITMLELKEGDYVAEGGTVVRLADLSTLWAEAQVYSSQLSEIDMNAVATVQIPDVPGTQMKGRIEFANPELNTDTRINLIRVSIPNKNNILKPGMPAYVFLSNAAHSAISLPIDAVIRDKKGATVWIKTGANTFASKMVQTGLENGESIEITSGLQPGEVLVVKGAYLLYSEYFFQKGGNTMVGMDMGSTKK